MASPMVLVEVVSNVMSQLAATIVADLSTGGLNRFTEAIAEKAAELAPVDTGYLRDNIYATIEDGEAVVRSDAEYSGFVEYGTAFTPAQPFLEPAIEEVANDTGADLSMWRVLEDRGDD